MDVLTIIIVVRVLVTFPTLARIVNEMGALVVIARGTPVKDGAWAFGSSPHGPAAMRL